MTKIFDVIEEIKWKVSDERTQTFVTKCFSNAEAERVFRNKSENLEIMLKHGDIVDFCITLSKAYYA